MESNQDSQNTEVPTESGEKDQKSPRTPGIGDQIEVFTDVGEWQAASVIFSVFPKGRVRFSDGGVVPEIEIDWQQDAEQWRWPSGKVAVPAAHAVSEKSAQPEKWLPSMNREACRQCGVLLMCSDPRAAEGLCYTCGRRIEVTASRTVDYADFWRNFKQTFEKVSAVEPNKLDDPSKKESQ